MRARALGWAVFETPIGWCGIAWHATALVGVQLPGEDRNATAGRMQRSHPDAAESPPPPWVADVVRRVQGLLEGLADDLHDVPLDMDGVPAFQQRVYALARAIPPGRTRTYGDLALELGDPGAARAVGQALGNNPFAPVVPCHRILAAQSRSGGFSAPGGVRTKLKMLEIESAWFGDEPGLF